MQELLARQLWIGNAHDIRGNYERLFELSIAAVVDLACDEKPAVLPRHLHYYRCPLADSADNLTIALRLAVKVTTMLLKEEVPTLVCCSAGMSRSPVIASLAVAAARRQPLSETMPVLLSGKLHDINAGLLNSAIEACRDLVSDA